MNLGLQIQCGFMLEKDMKWLRMVLIYMISGVGGFVWSIPMADIRTLVVGASGSLYGLISCLFLDLLYNWKLVRRPYVQLIQMIVTVVISFLVGMLPYIDNNAHVGGFIFGALAGLIFMPQIYTGKWDRRIKIVLRIVSIPVTAFLFYYCLWSFYGDFNFCPTCKYLNCIPGFPWCDEKWNTTSYLNWPIDPNYNYS